MQVSNGRVTAPRTHNATGRAARSIDDEDDNAALAVVGARAHQHEIREVPVLLDGAQRAHARAEADRRVGGRIDDRAVLLDDFLHCATTRRTQPRAIAAAAAAAASELHVAVKINHGAVRREAELRQRGAVVEVLLASAVARKALLRHCHAVLRLHALLQLEEEVRA